MKTTNTLEQTLADIDNKANEQKQAAILKAEICGKVNIPEENIILHTFSKKVNIHFGWRTALTKDEVKEVVKVFPIDGDNYEMRFASQDKNFFTDSSLIVKWENSHTYHHTKEFKLEYGSGEYKITITVPVSHFAAHHIYYRQFKGQHKGFGRYEMFNDMFIDYFYTQSYSGGYNTLYFLEGAEKLEEYINFVLTGEFKYLDEIEN